MNKTLIGAFVVGAIVVAVASVVAFGRGLQRTPPIRVIMYFEGSTTGLNPGSPVLMKGVQIGEVTGIALQLDMSTLEYRTAVRADVRPSVQLVGGDESQAEALREAAAAGEGAPLESMIARLVRRGLRAQLELQSIVTGVLMVSLDLRQDVEPGPFQREPDGTFVLPTMPSTMEMLSKSLNELPVTDLVQELRDLVAGLQGRLDSQEVDRILAGLADATEDLAALSDTLEERIARLDEQALELLQSADGLTDDLRAQVGPLSEDLDLTLADARALMQSANERVEPLSAELTRTADAATASLEELRAVLGQLRGPLPVEAELLRRVATTLEQLGGASSALGSLMTYLEQHPEALLQGKGN